MRADFGAVLDACVIIPMPLADTLFRLAEHPRLYLPRWTDEIMEEVTRNLIIRWNKTPAQATRRHAALKQAFPEAWVDDGYKSITALMTNDFKDRHVVAAAAHSKSEVIVTFNKKHFLAADLRPWGIECLGPSTFLRNLYDLDPPVFTRKLIEQSENLSITFSDLLLRLRKLVPGFIESLCEEQRIELPL
jgi:predicted nucleic acid-binding protein